MGSEIDRPSGANAGTRRWTISRHGITEHAFGHLALARSPGYRPLRHFVNVCVVLKTVLPLEGGSDMRPFFRLSLFAVTFAAIFAAQPRAQAPVKTFPYDHIHLRVAG